MEKKIIHIFVAACILLSVIAAVLMLQTTEEPENGPLNISRSGADSVWPGILATDNRLHAFWVERTLERGYVYHSWSGDGKEWSEPEKMTGNSYNPGKVFVSAYGKDIHLMWMERSSDIVYMNSTDGGSSWSAPSIIAAGDYPAISSGESGVYVAYIVKSPETAIQIIRRTESGSWERIISISDPGVGPPAIASFSGGVCVSWVFNDTVYFKKMLEIGGKFLTADTMEVTRGTSISKYIRISAGGDEIYISWLEGSGDSGSAHLAYSSDGGLYWSDANLGPASVLSPVSMFFDGDEMAVCWISGGRMSVTGDVGAGEFHLGFPETGAENPSVCIWKGKIYVLFERDAGVGTDIYLVRAAPT